MGAVCLAAANPRQAVTEAIKAFDLPADNAERSLKRLARQSGREVLFPAVAVEGVRTRAVKGNMTSRAALVAMLAGTDLTGVEDEETGSLTVRRESRATPAEKNVDRAAPKNGDRP